MQVMRRYLSEVESAALLRTVRACSGWTARRDAAWIEALLRSGMRIGEFSRMTCADARLALEAGFVFIPRERRKGKRRDHWVPVTRPLATALRALLATAAEAGGAADAVPLTRSRKGGAGMSVRGFQHRLAHWAAAAGLPSPVSPHWMRHTRAMTIMRRSSARDPRGLVQAALGHASIASTGIYTAVSKEDLVNGLVQVDGGGHGPVSGPALRARWEAVQEVGA